MEKSNTGIDIVIEELKKEIERVEELLKMYEGIPTGALGATIIRNNLELAKMALESKDINELINATEELKKCE